MQAADSAADSQNLFSRTLPEGVPLTCVNIKQGNILHGILEGMSLKCIKVKQGNISHLSESEGCEFGLVFIFCTSGMQAVQAGMVAAAAGMVVRTAGANMRIHSSKSIQFNFGSGICASCFLQFQDYVSQFLAWLIELHICIYTTCGGPRAPGPKWPPRSKGSRAP